MAKQTINIGSVANDGTGDAIRTAFNKCNLNFDEVYSLKANVNADNVGGSASAWRTAISAASIEQLNTKANADASGLTDTNAWRTALSIPELTATNAAIATRAPAAGVEVDSGLITATGTQYNLNNAVLTFNLQARWPQHTSGSQFPTLLSKGGAVSGGGYWLVAGGVTPETLGTINWFSRTSSGTHYHIRTNARFDDNKWHSVTVSADYTTPAAPVVKIYVDGVDQPITIVQAAAGTYADSTTSLCLAARNNAQSSTTDFRGQISRFIPFNRALTADEVAALHASGGVVPVSDRWGSVTPRYESDFSATTDGWNSTANITLAAPLDTDADGLGFPNSDDWLRATSISRVEINTTAANISLLAPYWPNQVYLFECDIILTDGHPWLSNSTKCSVNLYGSWSDGAAVKSFILLRKDGLPLAVGFQSVRAVISFPVSVGSFTGGVRIGPSAAEPAGILTYVKNITLTRAGAIAAYPLNDGIGRHIADLSSNGYHALTSATGVTHLLPKDSGRYTLTQAGPTGSQLGAGPLFDSAANRYRFDSYTVRNPTASSINLTHLGPTTGSTTYYTGTLTVAAGATVKVPLVTEIISGQSIFATASAFGLVHQFNYIKIS